MGSPGIFEEEKIGVLLCTNFARLILQRTAGQESLSHLSMAGIPVLLTPRDSGFVGEAVAMGFLAKAARGVDNLKPVFRKLTLI